MWTKFDHANVGTKTRHYNRQLYVQGIEPTWTPIKPVATRIVQVVRKQLSLRPAAAKLFTDHKVIPRLELWLTLTLEKQIFIHLI